MLKWLCVCSIITQWRLNEIFHLANESIDCFEYFAVFVVVEQLIVSSRGVFLAGISRLHYFAAWSTFPLSFSARNTVRNSPSGPRKTTPMGDMLVYAFLLMAPRSPTCTCNETGAGPVDVSAHYHGNSNVKAVKIRYVRNSASRANRLLLPSFCNLSTKNLTRANGSGSTFRDVNFDCNRRWSFKFELSQKFDCLTS